MRGGVAALKDRDMSTSCMGSSRRCAKAAQVSGEI